MINAMPFNLILISDPRLHDSNYLHTSYMHRKKKNTHCLSIIYLYKIDRLEEMRCPKTPPTIFLPSSSLVFSSVLAVEVLLEGKLPVAADPCLSTAVNHLYI